MIKSNPSFIEGSFFIVELVITNFTVKNLQKIAQKFITKILQFHQYFPDKLEAVYGAHL